MEPLLLLVHRLPYPPNKGDKIRSFNLLRHLAKKYDVYLATFIDDSHDWKYVDVVQGYCKQAFIRPLNSKLQKIKSLVGFITGDALTIRYYSDGKIHRWCKNVIKENSIKKAVVFSSSMAQYVDNEETSVVSRIVDFVDIDSDKWAQYADSMKWPFKQIYKREAKKLLEYECFIADKFDKSLFVSEAESDLFKGYCQHAESKIGYYNNGVDYSYFKSSPESKNPYVGRPAIVFTGAMDYWANIHAVQWFAASVLPVISKSIPEVMFYIVGSNPSEDVKKMANHQIYVTGRVDDIRPFIQYANVVVAPLQIARGVQNKVLEALSMEKKVVATSCAAEGLVMYADEDILRVCDTPEYFAKECVDLLKNKAQQDNKLGRSYVERNYDWDRNLSIFDSIL